MVDNETLLDFLTNPHWSELVGTLSRLIRELESKAARSETSQHEYERGRLAGAERALAILEDWRKVTKQELAKNAR